MSGALRHAAVIAAGLFVCLALPWLRWGGGTLTGVDAVSGASLAPPDAPSGECLVLVNRERHPLTLDDWTAFFSEREVGVIMEDISCLTAAADETGVQLATRYQARLAEHQMKLTREDGLLVVSRAEQGLYDVVILSREMADALDLSAALARPEAWVVTVSGAAA